MSYITKLYGPPGTGKTTWLINRVAEELANGVLPEQIAYTSFTKSAAYEARDRAIAKFSDFAADQFIWFSTIHSICFRRLELHRDNVFAGKALKEFCTEFGYNVGNFSDNITGELETEIQNQILQTDADFFEFFINWYRNLQLDFNDAYNQFIMSIDIPQGFDYDRLKMYIQRRNEYKREKALWDFCDMIETVLANEIYPSDDIKVMFSDEFQDLTPLLAQVVTMWSKKCERYYIAGDPYQAIYTWMGADPSILLDAQADKCLTLKQSYRCPVAVHDLSRRIVERFSSRYQDDDFTPKKQAGSVIKVYPSQIDWNALSGGKVFYLHRTHHLLSQAIAELMQNGVPFGMMRGQESPLQTVKAKVVSAAMRLLDGKRVPIADICKMMEYLPTRTSQGNFLTLGAKTDTKKMLTEKSGRTFSHQDLPRLGFTKQFMHYFNRDEVLTPFKLSLDERDYFRRLVKQFGVDILDKEPMVWLSTLHAIKGMECDTAIINLNLTKKTYSGLEDNPDPEHRLFYVAVTRSKDKVILVQPDGLKNYYL